MRDAETLRIEQSELKAKTAEERHATMLTLADEFEQDVGGIVATVSGAGRGCRMRRDRCQPRRRGPRAKRKWCPPPRCRRASTFKMVSAATEELTASICEINMQVAKSSRIAADAVVEAWRTDATVQGLAAAGQIGDVVGLIHTIAGQTNLPPLIFGISRDIRYLRQYRAGFTRGIPMTPQT